MMTAHGESAVARVYTKVLLKLNTSSDVPPPLAMLTHPHSEEREKGLEGFVRGGEENVIL